MPIARQYGLTWSNILGLSVLMLAQGAFADPAQWALSTPPIERQLQATFGYESHETESILVREQTGTGSGSLEDPLPSVTDFRAVHTTTRLVPRVAFGLPANFWLAASLPVTLSESRTAYLADGAVRDSLSAVRSGLISAGGLDAASGEPLSGDAFFRGVDRAGLNHLELGIGYTAMSQAKDSRKPTWSFSFDYLLPIGTTASYDRAAPSANDAVGVGTHDVRFRTAVTQRFGPAQPYWQLRWQAPIANRSDSLFQDPGFGARGTQRAQEAAVDFGVLLGFSPRHQRYQLELGGSVISHFEGRRYSELWELFAYAGHAGSGGPLVLDSDPTTVGEQAQSHPGVTHVENYLELQGTAAVHATIRDKYSLGIRGRLTRTTNHFITFADAGVDLPTCQGSTSGCEANENTVVTPNTVEVSPLYQPEIDLVGHRYRAQSTNGVALLIEASVTF